MNAVPPPPTGTEARPRVEGDREQEILDATLEVLADVGYDRLTMDAVATKAKASKATLYRRWNDKATLVIDAICAQKGPEHAPDTGTLRGDLIEAHCGFGGLTDDRMLGVLASIMTAINRDKAFAATFRRDFIGPKVASGTIIFDRAKARGEMRPDLDVHLIAPVLAGTILHRLFLLGQQVDEAAITEIIDQIILPACRPTDS